MVDEIIPADRYPDPQDNPLNELRPIEEPDHYNPPPRESLPPTERPRSPQPAVKLAPLVQPVVTPPNDMTDRLTVSIQAHHEQWGDEPTSFTCQFYANTELTDQSLKRKLKIGPDEKTLLTWSEYPEVAGYLGIKNRTGEIQMTRRSPEQAQALKEQNLLVSLCEDCPDEKALIVRPGRCFFAEMQDDTEIWLKSASGICEITVYVFPR